MVEDVLSKLNNQNVYIVVIEKPQYITIHPKIYKTFANAKNAATQLKSSYKHINNKLYVFQHINEWVLMKEY